MSKLTGEQIQQGRYAKRMTIRALARELGITAIALSNVEHGRNVLTDEQDAKAQTVLGVRPRVSTRGCVGFGGRFEDAVSDALFELRQNGHWWSSWSVASHTIEPFQGADGTWHHRHRVVLEPTRGAKRT